jgi:regulator of sigma E protease
VEIILSISAFIFVIGVMVLAHEWGHFFAARKLGIAVEVFSFGFGPKIFAWKRGETEYRISSIPVGGYVKMKAENPEEGTTGDPSEFLSRSRLERFFVLVMGPLLNIILAMVIWTGVLMLGEQREKWLSEAPTADYVEPDGPADLAGIKQGDRIKSVNGEPIANWEDLIYSVATRPRETLNILVERGGSERLIEGVQPAEDESFGIGRIGISPGYPSLVEGLDADGPARKAGLEEGDNVVAIDGRNITTWDELARAVQDRSRTLLTLEALEDAGAVLTPAIYLLERSGALDIELTVEREGETLSHSVRPKYDLELGFYRLGLMRPELPVATIHKGPLEALWGSVERSVVTTGRLFDILARMLTGRLSTKAVSGPVEIAAISGRTAEQGIVPLLNLMAFISLNLGIFNLLPLPVLDGGHIFILAIEGVRRRDISLKAKEWIMRLGLLFIFLLFALILYQDIDKLISRMGG